MCSAGQRETNGGEVLIARPVSTPRSYTSLEGGGVRIYIKGTHGPLRWTRTMANTEDSLAQPQRETAAKAETNSLFPSPPAADKRVPKREKAAEAETNYSFPSPPAAGKRVPKREKAAEAETNSLFPSPPAAGKRVPKREKAVEAETNSLFPSPPAADKRVPKRKPDELPQSGLKKKRRMTKAEKQRLAEDERKRKEEERRRHEIDLCKAQAPEILIRNCPVTVNVGGTSEIFVEGELKKKTESNSDSE